ncbi:DUF1611 domain-containing protein [Novosphingobium sp.]|uniref:DUF1611 domain-containing protein n=1 Tax=Novosphingobium sp. TaxID=1874826 RepID=UPI0038BB250A
MTIQVKAPDFGVIQLPQPYLLFLGDAVDPAYAKTALGLRDWAGDQCVGELSLPQATVTTGLPKLSAKAAYDAGARGLVIGIASVGGQIRPNWVPALVEALEAGLDVISGMHSSYLDVPELVAAIERTGRRFIEVRRPPADIPIGNGQKRSGKRLLTVGTDCALGKKYTALAIARAFAARGVDSDFRATGQTGIMIAGSGIPIDSIVCDFTAGAAEILSPAAPDDHWDVVEGQGSLFHPSYAGVSLGLLHGSQPDVLVVCHEAGRTAMAGVPGYVTPTLQQTIDLNLLLGSRTNPAIRCAGISLNTAAYSAEEAATIIAETSAALGLPVADPIRGGEAFERLVDACLI